MNCIICGQGLEMLVNSPKIWKCPNCGFGQTENPKVQTNQYHRDKVYVDEEKLFRNIFQKRVNIICRLNKSGSALEVGCSTGLMLYLLQKKNWEVLGVEISKIAANKANKRGIKVIRENFEKVKIDKKFDLIIFNHSLEHLQNPIKIIEKTKKMLKGNGLIYIDLPNFGGLSSKIYGKNWPLLLPNEHLWHFSLKSLEILFGKAGFKTIFVDRSSGNWNLANPWIEIFQSLIGFKKRFFMEILTILPDWIISKLGLGSDLMVIARKLS